MRTKRPQHKNHVHVFNRPGSAPDTGPSEKVSVSFFGTDEEEVLRIFVGGRENPQLVPLSVLSDSAIDDMLNWTLGARRIQIVGFPGMSKTAPIPGHKGFKATMHWEGDCMMVQISHRSHGVFFSFGVVTETSLVSQELWALFGGEGQQPSGPWCIEQLSAKIKDVFRKNTECPIWLINLHHSLSWMWIVMARAMKRYEVLTDPITGERVMKDKIPV